MIISSAAFAQWQSVLTATGEVGSAPNVFTFTIGQNSTQSLLLAPPAPPSYMTYIQLYESVTWNGPYISMIFANPPDTVKWIVEIDPNGNVVPPISRTTTLSWEPASFSGNGEYWLEDNATGNILVEDMRTFSEYDITGAVTIYLNICWSHSTSSVVDPISAPKTMNPLRNYPNPFNSSTSIHFTLQAPSRVIMKIYDPVGRLVLTKDLEQLSFGEHEITWNADHMASGVYLCRMETRQVNMMQKMVLLK